MVADRAECRQTCTAGYKALWSPEEGLPPTEFFAAAYPGFDAPAEKLGTTFLPLGSRAGGLTPDAAEAIGLPAGLSVAVGNVDSFVSVPGCGVEHPGTYVTVVGTSICDMVVDRREVRLPGITGVLRDGILPGLYGYEAGQVAVGDMLAWFVETLAPQGKDFAGLEEAAGRFDPGATGLVALDWWNGNRSILADAGVSGVIVGLTLLSTPEEIYRALLESIAFGNRRIVENFTEHGIELREIVACGGIAERSPLTDATVRRHERTAGARARLERGSGAGGGAVRGPRRRLLRGHRGSDRGHAARGRADLYARCECQGGLRPGLCDLPHAV